MTYDKVEFGSVQVIPEEAVNLDQLHALTRQGKTEVNWAERHSAWLLMWEQRRNRQPMLELITPGRAVASGYMEWFYTNGNPFIMTPEARARVLRAPRPELPRQQRGPRSTGASTHQTGGLSTSAGPGLAA
ncbi:hypothetical protein V6N13_012972 [Hibiscus sabdariffa]